MTATCDFVVGQRIFSIARFYAVKVPGGAPLVPLDPTTVTFRVQDTQLVPVAVDYAYGTDPECTRSVDDDGYPYYIGFFDPDEAGDWKYQWFSTGQPTASHSPTTVTVVEGI